MLQVSGKGAKGGKPKNNAGTLSEGRIEDIKDGVRKYLVACDFVRR